MTIIGWSGRYVEKHIIIIILIIIIITMIIIIITIQDYYSMPFLKHVGGFCQSVRLKSDHWAPITIITFLFCEGSSMSFRGFRVRGLGRVMGIIYSI